MTDSIFEVSELTVAYQAPNGGETVVVWDFRYQLEEGRILGLAGESGCGKSTAALTSIGYRPAGSRILSGRSQLGSLNLIGLRPNELRDIWGRRVAYVGQNAATALHPAIPIGKQLAQPMKRHLGLDGPELRRRQIELMESVGLSEPRVLRRYAHEFSGGQQQRIAIAIALSCRPEVLLLDEPTTGLDATTQARINALLRSLVSESGLATLYVSHDLALLSEISDRLVIMYAGEGVEEGSTRRIIDNPSHPYTRALLAAVPSAHTPRAVAGIPGQPPLGVQLDSCAFVPRCPFAMDVCSQGHVELVDLPGPRRVRCRLVDGISSHPRELPRLAPRETISGEPVLEVVNLRCEYKHAATPAVADMSFALRSGEALGIVGESGSGKSTLLRCIAGLHPPRAGKVLLEGVPLGFPAMKRSRDARRKIQIVFQNPESSLNPRHSVLTLIGRPIKLLRSDVRDSPIQNLVCELLDAVQLPRQVLHRYPDELSGGQKQRVALARAFAARPSVLLCDEVTASLDVSVQATIVELLVDLAQRFGTAVVFVSHDLGIVRAVASSAIVMRLGEVCEEGSIHELFSEPKHDYTKELLGSLPEIERVGAT